MKNFDERFWISIAVIAVAFAFDMMLYLVPSKADSNLISTIVGVLNSVGLVAVVQYWLGSSKGSQDKTDIISQLSSK